jgi:hypothetical protein
VSRALARIPQAEADQARQAQLARLQAIRMMVWNQASADPIRAAEGAAAPILQENVGTEWAVRPKMLPTWFISAKERL